MKRTIFAVVDGVAVGAMEVHDTESLLSEVQKKYPKAQSAREYEADSNVVIISTKDDGKR